jgi:hypothetical protein
MSVFGFLLTVTLFGAVIGIPVMFLSIPMVFLGIVWVYQGHMQKLQEIIAAGVAESLRTGSKGIA